MTLLRPGRGLEARPARAPGSLQKSRSVVETAAEQELAPARARRPRATPWRPATARCGRRSCAEHDVSGAAAPARGGRRARGPGCAPASGCARRAGGRGRRAPVAHRRARRAPGARARRALRQEAVDLLATAAEHRFGAASRVDRNRLREFARHPRRGATRRENFSVFDRLKADPDRCRGAARRAAVLGDDARRRGAAVPVRAGPLRRRGRRRGLAVRPAVDDAGAVPRAPGRHRGRLAPDAGAPLRVHRRGGVRPRPPTSTASPATTRTAGSTPTRSDLLRLAAVRADEEVLLDEHFRSLPPIIDFSNGRWYGGRLRLMRHARDRRHGDRRARRCGSSRCPTGASSPARRRTSRRRARCSRTSRRCCATRPTPRASIGVLCLFEEQVRLVEELVAEAIDDEAARRHRLVVVNPDGFQGDERDVILYSLSYDGDGMTKAQLSARQAEQEHVQGMLNVAFTRARDEVRVYHSAPLEQFATAAGDGRAARLARAPARGRGRAAAAARRARRRTARSALRCARRWRRRGPVGARGVPGGRPAASTSWPSGTAASWPSSATGRCAIRR